MQEELNNNENVAGSAGGNEINHYDHYYSRPPLGKGQKIAVVVLAFFSFFIVIAWAMQFKQTISEPLNKTATTNTTGINDSGAVNLVKDSDNDGLTDFDEINTYKTSPYLEDSDSDGFSDKKEIDSDKDPNCPTGVDCSGLILDQNTENTKSNNIQNATGNASALDTVNSNNTQAPLQLPVTTGSTTDLQKVLTGQVDAMTLRKTLIDSGMDKTALDNISDEELMASYQETLKK